MPCDYVDNQRPRHIYLLHRVDVHMLNRVAQLSSVQIMHKIRFESMSNTAGGALASVGLATVVPMGARNDEITMGMSTNNDGVKARHIRTRMNCIFSATVIGSFPLLSGRHIMLFVLALERGAMVARSEPGG